MHFPVRLCGALLNAAADNDVALRRNGLDLQAENAEHTARIQKEKPVGNFGFRLVLAPQRGL